MTTILNREGMRKAHIDDGKQIFQMPSRFLGRFLPSLCQGLLPSPLRQSCSHTSSSQEATVA